MTTLTNGGENEEPGVEGQGAEFLELLIPLLIYSATIATREIESVSIPESSVADTAFGRRGISKRVIGEILRFIESWELVVTMETATLAGG